MSQISTGQLHNFTNGETVTDGGTAGINTFLNVITAAHNDTDTKVGTLGSLIKSSGSINQKLGEVFGATQGQTVFTLTKGTYIMSNHMLDVWVNGVKKSVDNGDFTETSNTSFTMANGLNLNDKVDVEYWQSVTATPAQASAHATTHSAGGTDPIDIVHLQNYQTEVADKIGNLSGSIGVSITSYPRLGTETNDIPRFQRAIDHLATIGGGRLIVPNTGTNYTFTATTPTVNAPARVLISTDSVEIVGVGTPTIEMTGINKAYIDSIDDYNSSGRDVFTCFSFMRTSNCSIRGIRFEGNWDGVGTFRFASPRAKGVGFIGTTNCIAENLQGYGILGNLVNAAPSDTTIDGLYQPLTGITVNNCYAELCLENGFNYMGNTFDGKFTNNTATLCGSTGFESATVRLTVSNNICHQNKTAGMSLSGKYLSVVSNTLTENGSDSDDTVGAGIILSYAASIPSGNMIIKSNYIYGNKGFGVQMYPGISNVLFANNSLIDNCAKNVAAYNYGINIVGSATRISNITISDNIISDSLGYMIYAINAGALDIATIKNNVVTMYSTATLSIVVAGTCTEVVVSYNRVNKTVSVSASSTTSYGFNNFGYSKKNIEGTAAPTTGTWVAGDVFKNTNPTLTKCIHYWICTVGGTPGTWRSVGVGQGSTAGRPTLVANDAGYQYLDTTLAAAGKLITWTGTAWVDSTGTSV